jgi:hypothetical protein
MSRGPGKIERALDALFDAERDDAFTLEELCERVYPGVNRIEKKHRISVARAARRVLGRGPEIYCWRGGGLGGELVYSRMDEVLSYAMGQLKADWFTYYRTKDERILPHRRKEEGDLRALLAEGRYQDLVAPGGAWWRHVEMFRARRDGDHERLAPLLVEEEAVTKLLDAMAGAIRRR